MHWSLDLSPGSTSPLALLLHADIVVQIVMAGLLLASIWTWAIIIGFSTKLGGTRRKIDKFEKDFWKAEDIDAFYKLHGDDELPVARVFAAGVSEWRRSTAGGVVDREGIRERLATAMGSAVAGEADKLADRLNILATVGSVAPFVGLFGTVWGIMSSFQSIAASKNTSLAVVAPGIAEALFATAIGLIAAIPATIFYNKFASEVNRQAQRLEGFADEFSAILSRQIDERA